MKPRYKIKEFRKELNMSQEELANKAGISRATLSKLEELLRLAPIHFPRLQML